MRCLLLLLLLLLLLPSSARAQDEKLAQRYFQRAIRLFEKNRFREAAEEFQRAFLADHRRPWFLYNIGQSYERLAAQEPDSALALLALRRAFVAYRDHYLAISQRLQLRARQLTLVGLPGDLWQMPEKPDGLERGDGTLQAALPWPGSPPDSPSSSPSDAPAGMPPEPTEDPLSPGPLPVPRDPAAIPSAETMLQALPGGELAQALERQEQRMRAQAEWLQRRARWRRTRQAAGLTTLLPGVAMSVLGGNLLGRLPALRERLADVQQGTSTSELLPLVQRIERHSIASSVLLPVGLALVSVGVTVLIPSW
jgi:tetratricopeptide (TPR) repeat protein